MVFQSALQRRFVGVRTKRVYIFNDNNFIPNGKAGACGELKHGFALKQDYTSDVDGDLSTNQLYNNNNNNNTDLLVDGEGLVIKESIPGRHLPPLAIHSKDINPMPYEVIKAASLALQSPQEEVCLEHVSIFKHMTSGEVIYAIKDSVTGTYKTLNLRQLVDIFGMESPSSSSSTSAASSFPVPRVWTKFHATRNRMRKEIDILTSIPKHPNLIELIDHGEIWTENECRVFLVLPYYKNGDILNVISTVDERTRINYLIQICEAVNVLHAHGYCHRDIKIDNILISDDRCSAILADFGLASTNIRRNHNKVGTELIRAPEIFRYGDVLSTLPPNSSLAKGYDGCKADIWSLGVLIFQLVSLDNVHYIENNKRIYMKHALPNDLGYRHICTHPNPNFPASVPQNIKNLLLSVLKPEPYHRLPLPDIIAFLQAC